MKIIILLVALLINYTKDYAQNGSNKEINVFDEYKFSVVELFSNPKWQGGNIYLNDGTIINGYVFKYNIITDEIEVKANINPANVEYISIGGKLFSYSKYINEYGSESGGYFEVLVRGDCQLLMKRTIEEVSETTTDMALGKEKEKNNVKETYYIKKYKQPAVIIKNKKNLIDNLSDKKGFIEYMDDKVLFIITKRGAMKIIEYYNRL